MSGRSHAPASTLLTPGVSRELALHRASTVDHLRYELDLRVPELRAEPLTGTVTLRFQWDDPAGHPLVVDLKDPGARIGEVQVNGHSVPDPDFHNNHVVLPAPLLRSDRDNLVRMGVRVGDGPLNRRDTFLYTLFVPDRAHHALPVLDQPDLKARVSLSLEIPSGWEAVANGRLERAEGAADGRRRLTFAETEPIPTYLIAFTAGEWERIEREVAGRPMVFYHRETDSQQVSDNLDAIFRLHATALDWLEEYTGIPYPFDLFEFVAVPDLQYQGMEHPGVVYYRASSLFLESSVTRGQLLNRATLIAHETAHMWFGNLVTMRWFDDVWMKEVFANFCAAKIVSPFFPDLDHDVRFLLAHYPAAYRIDRSRGANPIRQSLHNLDEAGTLYGPIIYHKAPIAMRQLERLLGEERFRGGVRRYLERFAFGSASWPDLIEILDPLTELDLTEWSRDWVEEPGRPTVEVAQGATAHFPDGLLPDGAGHEYALFRLDSESRSALLAPLYGMESALHRASALLILWDSVLEGELPPEELLQRLIEGVMAEGEAQLLEEGLEILRTIYWMFLCPEARKWAAPRVEESLLARLGSPDPVPVKATLFGALRSVASTPETVQLLQEVWEGERAFLNLVLGESDRTATAFALALRGVRGWEQILEREERSIDDRDRLEGFRFLLPSVHPDPRVREGFFDSLRDRENRSREAWVTTGLAYLNHPLRSRHALRFLHPSLELLEEIQRTGDIFFPQSWMGAALAGHGSPEAVAIVETFLAERPDYPPRLREKILQALDQTERAARIRGARCIEPEIPRRDSSAV